MMKRINQPRFFELSIAELRSPHVQSVCVATRSKGDSKTKETCLTEISSISNAYQKVDLNVILKLNAQARAHLKSSASSLINIFTNHVPRETVASESSGFHVEHT